MRGSPTVIQKIITTSFIKHFFPLPGFEHFFPLPGLEPRAAAWLALLLTPQLPRLVFIVLNKYTITPFSKKHFHDEINKCNFLKFKKLIFQNYLFEYCNDVQRKTKSWQNLIDAWIFLSFYIRFEQLFTEMYFCHHLVTLHIVPFM